MSEIGPQRTQKRLDKIVSSDQLSGGNFQKFLEESPHLHVTTHDVDSIVKGLRKKPWCFGEYKMENWGNRLHAVAPYIGRIKPAFAHWLIRICSKPGDIVLDPFCGIATVPLECDLLERKAVGFDLNPYAVVIGRAKFDRRPLQENLEWLRNVELPIEKVDIDKISLYIKQFYHEKTLGELYALKEKIVQDKMEFLLGCLLGICHGHRPQYLSAWTGYIVPFEPKTSPEYKEVIPRMIAKVKRTYQTTFPLKTDGNVFQADVRKIPIPENSIDIIISSPPYFDTIDYVGTNRLRLAILGYEDVKKTDLQKKMIHDAKTYLSEMKSVGEEITRVLKNNSLCIFVLGDVHRPSRSINTAEEVSRVYKDLGFRIYGVIEDEIPVARRTALKWAGSDALKTKRKKFDRILVMQLKK